MLNSTEHEFSTSHKPKILKNKDILAFKLSNVVVIMLINVKCQQFNIYEHAMHEKKFYNSKAYSY